MYSRKCLQRRISGRTWVFSTGTNFIGNWHINFASRIETFLERNRHDLIEHEDEPFLDKNLPFRVGLEVIESNQQVTDCPFLWNLGFERLQVDVGDLVGRSVRHWNPNFIHHFPAFRGSKSLWNRSIFVRFSDFGLRASPTLRGVFISRKEGANRPEIRGFRRTLERGRPTRVRRSNIRRSRGKAPSCRHTCHRSIPRRSSLAAYCGSITTSSILPFRISHGVDRLSLSSLSLLFPPVF